MKFYITDTTISAKTVKLFDNYNDVVRYLNQMSVRHSGQSRKERMLVLEEIGHGPDDPQGVNFVRAMSQIFDMGVVRENNLIRCDIPAIVFFQKEEFGN